MSGEIRDAADASGGAGDGVRLDSWKEIAAYLRRDVTTVRRWEKREGLPVHRHTHDKRDSVFAHTAELDAWLGRRVGAGALNGDRATAGSPRRRNLLRWAAALAAILPVAAAVLAWWAMVRRTTLSPPATPEPMRFAIAPPAESTFGSITLSPDGRQLAFTSVSRDGDRQLWVRPIGSVTATPIPGGEHAAFPFWSPDSQSIGYFAQGKLKTVHVAGGLAHVVCDAAEGRGGSWSREGVILFAPGRDTPLVRVPATGGRAVPVTAVNRPRERGHLWPEFLPDGRHFIYLADAVEAEHHGVYVASLDSDRPKRLMNDASNVTYTTDGQVLFARERRLVAQPFDLERLELSGDPVVIAESVREHFDAEHLFDFSATASGILVYRSMPSLETRLTWRDRTGAAAPFAEAPALYADPSFSPDRRRIAVDIFDPQPSPRFGFAIGNWTSDIWIYDVATGARSRFTFDPAADFEPVWSPDGGHLAFSSNRRGSLDLYLQDTRGGPAELLLQTGRILHSLSWTPDGRHLLYAAIEEKTRFDLFMLPVSGDRRPRPLLRTDFSEHQATVSPDGRWVAYTSNETGRHEVYVQGFPSLAGKWQISSDGGGDARWRPDGRELFFIGEDRSLMVARVDAQETFRAEPPSRLFDTGNRPGWSVARNHYDVNASGDRFLFMAPLEDDRTSPLTVVVNWKASLARDSAR